MKRWRNYWDRGFGLGMGDGGGWGVAEGRHQGWIGWHRR